MLLSALAVVAAGCGGGNSDKQANETYATGVCKAIDTWATQVKNLATVPTGGITKASIDATLSQFETATKTLVSEIKAVPPPNTSEGHAARKQIDQLASQVQTDECGREIGFFEASRERHSCPDAVCAVEASAAVPDASEHRAIDGQDD